MRFNRLVVVLVLLSVAFIQSAPTSAAWPPRFNCHLNNAAHPNIKGRAHFVRQSAGSRLHVRARNLRPGKTITLYVRDTALRDENVTRGGRLEIRVAGSGLVDYLNIRGGSRVVLKGPEGHNVASCRLKRSG